MKLTYQNFDIFKKDLYHFENIEELYSKLMNILSLICFQTGYYYCFCNQYSGCELSYDRGLRLCPLCQISVHFVNFEEELDTNQHNLRYLKQFAHELYPFLEKCYKINKQSLEAFSGDYIYSSRDWCTGQKTDIFLKEMIDYRNNIKKSNSEKCFGFF